MSIKITEAKNGFIVTLAGESYILSFLSDLWSIESDRYEVNVIGQSPNGIYAPGYGLGNLLNVRSLTASGNKISAIKLFRDIYTTRLDLKEAKELVELIVGEV